MDPLQQIQAWTMAHRVILAYLVKVVATLPSEQGAADQTATMLRNSLPQLFSNQPPQIGAMLTEAAEQEIDRIFTAPVGVLPSSSEWE